jgi:SAM-dependent methyltransferase
MDQNDWYSFFKDRPLLDTAGAKAFLRRDKDFFALIDKVRGTRKRILEAGCGPGKRMISYAMESGCSIMMIDRDPFVVELARKNRESVQAQLVTYCVMDFFKLSNVFRPNEFGVVTHHGVLEHYEPHEIRQILEAQLSVAHDIVFAVPVDSDYNRQLFEQDGIERHLWSVSRWTDNMLANFSVKEQHLVRSDKDELIVHIGNRAK